MRTACVIFHLVVMMSSFACFSATLSVGQTGARAGELGVTVPLSILSAQTEQISGLQVDIAFNNKTLDVAGISAGAAAITAKKDVSSSMLSAGVVRLIIAGLNQNVIPDGVVANLSFNVATTAPNATEALTLSNVLAADPVGLAVPISMVSGSITVLNSTEGEVHDPIACGCVGGTLSSRDGGKNGPGDVLVLLSTALGFILMACRLEVNNCAKNLKTGRA